MKFQNVASFIKNNFFIIFKKKKLPKKKRTMIHIGLMGLSCRKYYYVSLLRPNYKFRISQLRTHVALKRNGPSVPQSKTSKRKMRWEKERGEKKGSTQLTWMLKLRWYNLGLYEESILYFAIAEGRNKRINWNRLSISVKQEKKNCEK